MFSSLKSKEGSLKSYIYRGGGPTKVATSITTEELFSSFPPVNTFINFNKGQLLGNDQTTLKFA